MPADREREHPHRLRVRPALHHGGDCWICNRKRRLIAKRAEVQKMREPRYRVVDRANGVTAGEAIVQIGLRRRKRDAVWLAGEVIASTERAPIISASLPETNTRRSLSGLASAVATSSASKSVLSLSAEVMKVELSATVKMVVCFRNAVDEARRKSGSLIGVRTPVSSV